MSVGYYTPVISDLGLHYYHTPGFLSQGRAIFVKPYSGNDANDGYTPDRAVATLTRALAQATANQNDTVFLFAESNTSANTTDYQDATRDWNKDLVHLIGVNSGSPMSNRSRVAFASDYDTASNLFTLSADACIIYNLAFFAGVAGTNPTGCFKISGTRNELKNCHLAGIGHANNDIAGAYSLLIDGAEECRLTNCRIGLNTVDAGTAANSEILFDGGAKNIFLDNCLIYRRIEHATNHPLVKLADATAIDEFIIFDDCQFVSTSTNYAFSNAGAFKLVSDLTQGIILVTGGKTLLYNGTTAGKWDVDDRDKIKVMLGPTPADDTAGIARAV